MGSVALYMCVCDVGEIRCRTVSLFRSGIVIIMCGMTVSYNR